MFTWSLSERFGMYDILVNNEGNEGLLLKTSGRQGSSFVGLNREKYREFMGRPCRTGGVKYICAINSYGDKGVCPADFIAEDWPLQGKHGRYQLIHPLSMPTSKRPPNGGFSPMREVIGSYLKPDQGDIGIGRLARLVPPETEIRVRLGENGEPLFRLDKMNGACKHVGETLEM